MIHLTEKDIASKESLAKSIAAVLDDKLALDIKILDVESLTSLCSYFVICTSRSDTHTSALADDVDDAFSKLSLSPLHREGSKESGWIVLDYASVVVHIFNRQSREFYGIEKLWKDGKEVLG